MTKQDRLLALAKLRQQAVWPGYRGIADLRDGVYDCDYVSPYTKSAHNVDDEVMVLLQDWSGSDALSGPLDVGARDLGYTPTEATNRNLQRLLRDTSGLSLADTYATNLFPFVKPGGMSESIPDRNLVRAAREFALPQIEIVAPRLVICLGKVTFDAVRSAVGLRKSASVEDALQSHFQLGPSRVWFQAHTGRLGQNNRNRGGVNRVGEDWLRMKSHLESRG